MSAKPRISFHGMQPGECPVAIIEISLDGENDALLEQLLRRLFGATKAQVLASAPIAPLTKRGT